MKLQPYSVHGNVRGPPMSRNSQQEKIGEMPVCRRKEPKPHPVRLPHMPMHQKVLPWTTAGIQARQKSVGIQAFAAEA